jgi:hypothetical protein
MLVVFYRKPKVSGVPMRRLRRIDGMEAYVTKQVEARIWRWHVTISRRSSGLHDTRQHFIGPLKAVL